MHINDFCGAITFARARSPNFPLAHDDKFPDKYTTCISHSICSASSYRFILRQLYVEFVLPYIINYIINIAKQKEKHAKADIYAMSICSCIIYLAHAIEDIKT